MLAINPAFIVITVMIVALILFISGIIPIPATAAMVCIVLYVTGIIDKSTALKSFASDNVMIIACLGIIGEAAFRTGAAAKMGLVLKKFAKSERQFAFWLTVGSGILSGFLSNNGAAALIISLTLGICFATGMRRNKMMYPIVLGVCFGGGITTIGSNSTLYIKETLESMGNGQSMAFFELAPICLILILICAVFISTIGFNMMPEEPRNQLDSGASEEPDYSAVPKWKMYLSFVVLIGTIVAMYFEKEIGISLGFISMIGALIVVCARLVTDKQAVRAIPMNAIIMYACMVPVSTAVTNSGAGEMIAGFVQNMLGGTTSSLVVILLLFAIIVPITNCMSNSATIIMFCPIAIAVAQAMGMDVKAAMIAVRLAGTIGIATPIALPPNTMAMEPGGYNFMDYVKPGIPLTVICCVVSIIYLYVVYPMW